MTRLCVDRRTGPLRLRAARTDTLFCPFTAPTFAEHGVRTVCILYDLQHLAYPWFFSTAELASRARSCQNLIARADHIVCISEFSRISLIRHLGARPDQTSVVPIAIHDRIPRYSLDAAWKALSAYSLPRCQFAFYPANFWPHKNHRMLLVAFGRFVKEHPSSNLHLVLSGDLLAEGDFIRSASERMGLSSRVHVLGFVPEEHLGALWSAAAFLIFPSLFEGFGIPLTEAMSFGTPILCSRAGSLPEVGGDAASYFDARNPQTLVEALALGVQRPDELARRAARGQAQLANYRADEIVARYLDVLDQSTPAPPARSGSATPERDEDGHLLEPFDAYVRYLEASVGRPVAAPPTEVTTLQSALEVCESDRAARLAVIQQQGEELGRLHSQLNDPRFLTARVRTLRARRFSPRRILARVAGRLGRGGARDSDRVPE